MVFDMQNGTHGGVCFSEDVLMHEFVQSSDELASFTVMDDCHSTPFQIHLTVSTEDLEKLYGIRMESLIRNLEIILHVENPVVADFHLFDASGKVLQAFAEEQYSSGTYVLQVQPVLSSGMYFISTRVQEKQFVTKVVVVAD
jgi:hypothetical protein